MSRLDQLEDKPRFILFTISQKVDLDCCFLIEDDNIFYCRRDLDGADLISCEDCQVNSKFLRSSLDSELQYSGTLRHQNH